MQVFKQVCATHLDGADIEIAEAIAGQAAVSEPEISKLLEDGASVDGAGAAEIIQKGKPFVVQDACLEVCSAERQSGATFGFRSSFDCLKMRFSD